MGEASTPAHDLLKKAFRIYAYLVFVGVVDDWEYLDGVIRSGVGTETKLNAFRYVFTTAQYHRNISPRGKKLIDEFLGNAVESA